jgi:pimeloyl-ACP methyl ester carboxylesterase
MENSFSASQSETQYAVIQDYKIAYRSIGEGSPIILCNRFRGNLDDWDPAFLDALAKNYKVITFNHKGLASSSGIPHDTILGFAQDALDLADYLKIDQFILGGWSLGGWAAQVATTEFPERISHTILIGTKPPGKVAHTMEQIFLDTAYIPDYTLEHETILFFEPASELSKAAAFESHQRINQRENKDPKITQEFWVHYNNAHTDYMEDPYKSREKLMESKVPILVISSHHEVCFPPENWFDLNQKLPTTTLITIPQSGHGPQHQYPEMISDFIHTFIRSMSY